MYTATSWAEERAGVERSEGEKRAGEIKREHEG